MNRRHLEFRWQGRFGARFGWERRILRDRAGVFLVIYRLHYYGPAGYVCESISLNPRWSRQQFAMHVRGLRERLRWRVAQASQLVTPCSPMLVSPDAPGMAYAGIDAGPQNPDDRPCSHA